jgi:hypothetical protein
MLMGGLSTLFFIGSWAFMDRNAPVTTIAEFAYVAAFLCNHPHFFSSYNLLYGDYRKRIFQQRSYLWAAVIVPLILGGLICTALAQTNAKLMAHIITGMYFLVGWHYVKQVFGCVIVTSVQRKIFYKPWQRRVMLFNLFTVWFMSWVRSHVGSPAGFDFYGIPHYSLNLPEWHLNTVYALAAGSGFAVIWMHYQMYLEKGIKPSPPAVAAFVSIYAWYLPTINHPGFAYLIPFFHSMQYLAFVWSLKRNQVAHEIRGMNEVEWRKAWMRKFVGWGAGALILGALFFEIIPDLMDAQHWIPQGSLGTNPILVGFLLFINIHHYFIDNVIWRSDNQTVRNFLFQTETPKLQVVQGQKAA